MTSAVLRLQPRRIPAVLIVPERNGDGWLTLVGSNGWLFGGLDEAREEAGWLSQNFGWPVRELFT